MLGICYIRPLGVEHGDLRALRLLPDVSLGLRCETPSEKPSGTSPVSAIHPLPPGYHPNIQNRNLQDINKSERGPSGAQYQ